jgi:hypothetical protein
MSLTFTAWRLAHLDGRPAHCLISERDGRWQVLIWEAVHIVVCERWDSDAAALARADELWRQLVEQGWSAHSARPFEPYRRACPHCHQSTGVVMHRHPGTMALVCTTCQHAWDDSARVAQHDRRLGSRAQLDRRAA